MKTPSNIIELRPHEIEAQRDARVLEPVRVLQPVPQIRETVADVEVSTAALLASAPRIMALALKNGWAQMHRENVDYNRIANKNLKAFTPEHLENLRAARRLSAQRQREASVARLLEVAL